MSDVSKLIKKVNEVITLLKADPATKLPGVLINKAAPAAAPATAPAPHPPKMSAPKPSIPKPPKAPEMQMSAPMGKTLESNENDKSMHLAKWMKKCSGSMKMKKNDLERERITDGVVAVERHKDNQDQQRKEQEDQIAEHKKAANAYKEDKIDQDKNSKPVKSVKESVNKAEPKLHHVEGYDSGKHHVDIYSDHTGKKFQAHVIDNESDETVHKTGMHDSPKEAGSSADKHLANMKKSEDLKKPQKLDDCVADVKAKQGGKVEGKVNAYAVCNASIKKADGAAPTPPLGGTGTGAPSTPTPRPNTGFGAVVVKAKDQQGVHQAHFGASPKSGTSAVGAHMAPGGAAPATNKWAKGEHIKIFNTLKAMKKPNLP